MVILTGTLCCLKEATARLHSSASRCTRVCEHRSKLNAIIKCLFDDLLTVVSTDLAIFAIKRTRLARQNTSQKPVSIVYKKKIFISIETTSLTISSNHYSDTSWPLIETI
ncbi:hypothetical protein GJ496_001132 [Pomphorhynchus laevis]|nr:hypothetical protein GJ496_001132 [Pomphorhynchus laevis]